MNASPSTTTARFVASSREVQRLHQSKARAAKRAGWPLARRWHVTTALSIRSDIRELQRTAR